MNTIFSYNVNAKHSTKDLKEYHKNTIFPLLNVVLGEKDLL